MKLLTIAVAVCLLASCDSEVKREYHPEQNHTEKGSVSCDKGPGYCYACGLGFNGKFECSLAFKYSCPGSRPALLEIHPYTSIRKSGKRYENREVTTAELLGNCT